MQTAFRKGVLYIVVFSLIFCIIGVPNISVESVTSSSSSGADSKGPRMDHLQIKFYENQSAEFQGLLNNEIDFMDSPLAMDQYQSVLNNPEIEVVPYCDFTWYEIAFNNNATDPSHTQYRKAMNYTEFRQAMACLVDKDGLIAGPELGGLATRIDTPMPRPMLDNWVNFNVSKYDSNGNLLNNYPWDYNETHALEILWNNGWYSHTTYPTLASLLTAFKRGPLPEDSVVYPPGHPKAGQPIDTIIGYTRSDDPPRTVAGIAFANEMTKLGINVTNNLLPKQVFEPGGCWYPVYEECDYDFYTAGTDADVLARGFPVYFCSAYTPLGIGSYFSYYSNFYMISDANLTYHATLEYPNATSISESMNEALICQDIIVQEAMLVPLYSVRSFIAYRKGWLGVVSSIGGYGSSSNYGLRNSLDYLMLNVQNENPRVNTIRFGTTNAPEEINPILGGWLGTDGEEDVIDTIFTCSMITNPYKTTSPGKSPQGGDMPWMVSDWRYEQGPDGNAIVTLWFNHDIKWQDGVPFTVEDFNYTIYLNQAYDDSLGYGDFIHVKSFEKIDNWTCKLYFDSPSKYALYWVNYNIVPKHIYQYIDVPVPNDYATGHHGEWPGKDATAAQVHAPLNYTQLQLDGDQVWVGTGMWKYQPGSYVSGAGGGIMFDANRDFFLDTPPLGEMDFNSYWNSGSPPQSGSYKVGLSDLVMLANAYGSTGNPLSPNWNPACDIAAPSGIVGLSDLVVLAINYGKEWGNYTADPLP